jgi:hypothetical protein
MAFWGAMPSMEIADKTIAADPPGSGIAGARH